MEAKMRYTAEEAMKRLTDCIHFLASPVACQKGSECEFRHNEAARSNFKACWYWNNRKCLNPNCTFRHHPLKGVSGTPGAPTESTSLYTNPSKRNIPCYYFQKGQCITGDKCLFMHRYNPTINNALQVATSLPHQAVNNNPQVTSKVSTSLPQLTIPKNVHHSRYANIVENFPKISMPSYPLDCDEYPRSQPIGSVNTSSKPHSYQPQLIEEHSSNAQEAEDLMGGSSPSFNVLVDDEEEEYVRQSDFYDNDDDYDQRNFNPSPKQDDFDYYHPNYGYKRRMHENYDRDCHGSVERIHQRVSIHRDLISNVDKYDEGQQSSLKKRKVDDHNGDPYERDASHADYRYMDSSSRRDAYVSRERSLSSRLRSRIEVPSSDFRGRKRSLISRLHGRTEIPSAGFKDRERSLSSRLQGRIEVPSNEFRYREISLSSRLQSRIKVPSNEFRYSDRSLSSRLQSRIEVPLTESREKEKYPKDFRNSERKRSRRRKKRREKKGHGSQSDRTSNRIRDDAYPLSFAGPKGLEELKAAKVMKDDLENVNPNYEGYENEKIEGEYFKSEDRENAYGDDE